MFWCSSVSEFFFLEGNLLKQSAKTISFQVCTVMCSHSIVILIAYIVNGVVLHV